MKKDPEQSQGLLSGEEVKMWDFYVAVGVQGADELRRELGLDELNFRRLAPNLNRNPKQYFLYRILDEIQKAALKIAYWKEYLSEAEPGKLQRIDFETVIDDQQFRARKLAEALVDCILFSTTNDQAHYGDYLFLHELNECARSQEDRYEFFGFHNKNSEWNANRLCDEIRNLEKAGLNPKSRWYIKDGKLLDAKWTKKGVPFSSFRDRYKKILPIALPSEFNTLGKSYVHAYSMSKDVHFTPHDTSWSFDEAQISHGVDRVGLLILALIIRCQLLLGCVPEGMNKCYREMHDSNTGPAKLAQSLKTKPAEKGDVVWIHGYYAEVLNIIVSKYGYPAYHVKYIEHSPLADVPDDWFAGFEVKLVANKTRLEKVATDAAEEIQKSTGSREDGAKLLDSAKRAVVRCPCTSSNSVAKLNVQKPRSLRTPVMLEHRQLVRLLELPSRPRSFIERNKQMKHVNFKFPEPDKGIVTCDFTVEAKDESEAASKLNDYLTELKKLFFRPPIPVGNSSDPKVIGQECISRLKAITDPTAFVVTLHLFTEQWLNQILLKFCPHGDLTDYAYFRKLEICHAMGKLTEDLFFNLRKLNKLRNKVAHDLNFDLTKLELDYRGCLPDFELSHFKPSFHPDAKQHHISNILVGVMFVTFGLLQDHCVKVVGFQCSPKP